MFCSLPAVPFIHCLQTREEPGEKRGDAAPQLARDAADTSRGKTPRGHLWKQKEEKFLSLLHNNPALQRRIRGGLSCSEPRALFPPGTNFSQGFRRIWKALASSSSASPSLHHGHDLGAAEMWGMMLNFLISEGTCMAPAQVTSLWLQGTPGPAPLVPRATTELQVPNG